MVLTLLQKLPSQIVRKIIVPVVGFARQEAVRKEILG